MNGNDVTGARVDVGFVLTEARLAVDSPGLKMRLDEARASVAELIEDVAPLIRSLQDRITADNAMTPQAVMVRRAAAALARVGGAP